MAVLTNIPFLHRFSVPVDSFELPEKFTFPFYYEPHELAVLASQELKSYLANQTDFEHNFGLNDNQPGLVIGKMFGVLVVKDQDEQLGYLAAFSGKLGNSNHHAYFVPPVFDLLEQDSFFKKEEVEINDITLEIQAMEESEEYYSLKAAYQEAQLVLTEKLSAFKQRIKAQKKQRDILRQEYAISFSHDTEKLEAALEELRRESVGEQLALKRLQKDLREHVELCQQRLEAFEVKINSLKEKRAAWSADLQRRIFEQYTFLNQAKEERSLNSIFQEAQIAKITDGRPPAGAGECAAPKLLQFAFLNDLKPICMAEFWWGESPKSEIRIHEHYYPACRGKCEPILGHMLAGIEMDTNPMLENPADGKELPIVYEDAHLLVVNKPHDFLSVPGKSIIDSVYERIRAKFPNATGPLIVHRLDMSTSGLMVLALNLEVYHNLQHQFIRRKVSKRYTALLDGEIMQDSGRIELPLRVDLEDRPRQMVCYEYGKHALTTWDKIQVRDGKTLVNFYPHTGRTHQLRVHAAHVDGLNAPIIGDDLYGKKASRLFLHAAYLKFMHPISKEILEFEVKDEFDKA